MKIIIQAGGLGSRMKRLTHNKPKSLISAKYLPIIFNLFRKYPKDEFVIIGDYKFDVLDRYLAVFARDVNYILIKAKTKGNGAGIKEAVSFIPENEPFMLIWSDLILSDAFNVSEIKEGCQVGIADFPCSWSLCDGKLINEQKRDCGVAGLYVFNNKNWFCDFPCEGSFTKWLADKGIPLFPLSLKGSIDIGTIEAYNALHSTANRSRPYNKIEFIDGNVVKTALTSDGVKLLEYEILWYKKMRDYGFASVPKIYCETPLTIELINGTNVFLADLDAAAKKNTLDKIISALSTLHKYERTLSSAWDIYTEYFKKTMLRLQSIATALPFAFDETIRINGIECRNVLYSHNILRASVLGNLMNTYYAPIHGDCQLTNTMMDKTGKIFFIDARGYFGGSKVLGDVRYDWAKVYYALAGNFDQFNIKNFELNITGEGVNFAIGSGGWEQFTGYFLEQIPQREANIKEIKLIHAIIWLSLASHVWEDFDSMCVAFYNGTLLFNEWFKEYGDGK
ncbi:MAG: nucleoside-diphosphate-sugar pyrophosphorylase [Elusimicrobiota bacterium]|jgi:GTP:adenosylcobinamide-phosphate guanylyltransferase|nr:nucleoside-diphosphate-sugar pyrophosphorylase [Elusimicrobiota bacterium]